MSNYTKSFNFRNGVQVDDSSLIVNASGLVGIGTTRPEKRLDVFGNARVSGISSLSTVIVTEVVTIGAGITLDATSGIITATKFVGDASGLQNIVAIATDGWLANSGTLSTVGGVGVGTTIFTNVFEVKGNSKFFDGSVTFDDLVLSKNIKSSGIITATKFVGTSGAAAPFDNINVGTAATVGILTVNSTSTLNGDVLLPNNKKLKFGDENNLQIYYDGGTSFIEDAATGNLHLKTNGSEIKIEGASTSLARFYNGGSVELHHNGSKKFETTGTGVTVTGTFGSSGGATVPNLRVTGISTFEGTMSLQSVSIGQTVGFGSTAFFPDNKAIYFGESKDLRIFHGQSPNSSGSGNQHSYIQDAGTGDLVILSNQVAIRNAGESEDLARFTENEGVKLSYDGAEKIQTIGVGASVFGQLNVARLNGGSSGLSSSYGGLRYGNESGNFAFSTRKSLDLLNYDTGNINFYLDGSNINSGIGSFVWHRGLSSPLMTLNAEGNLGIGLTEPQFKLQVQGNAKISGITSFASGINVIGGNVVVTNNIQAGNGGNGEFNFTTGIMSATTFKGNTGEFTTGTINNLVIQDVGGGTGIATMSNLETGSIGINTNPISNSSNYLTIGNLGAANQKVFVNDLGQIGIRTSFIPSSNTSVAIGINARNSTVLVKALGIGTADFTQNSAADFSNAGTSTSRYMVPPVVDATGRAALTGSDGTAASIPVGAIIFDTSNGKLRYFTGNTSLPGSDGGWVDV